LIGTTDMEILAGTAGRMTAHHALLAGIAIAGQSTTNIAASLWTQNKAVITDLGRPAASELFDGDGG
jgi:hypothetical protein